VTWLRSSLLTPAGTVIAFPTRAGGALAAELTFASELLAKFGVRFFERGDHLLFC
jgi:hypothetical protein